MTANVEGRSLPTPGNKGRRGRGVPEGERSLHEGRVSQALGEVAEVMMRSRIHLFAVQPDWTGERNEVAEQCGGFGRTTAAGECLDEPERTGQKGSISAVKAVLPRWIPIEQWGTRVELLDDGVDGSPYAGRVGGLELQLRQDQECGIDVG